MTSPRNPHDDQRPLPPEIYRRRRIAAIVALVVVIALLWWVVSSLTGGDDESVPVAQQTQSESGSAAPPEPSGSSGGSTSASASGEPSEDAADPSGEATATEAAGEPSEGADELANKDSCVLEDLQLSVRPGAPTFRDGDQPNFFLEVTNPTGADCDIDLSEDELRFEVFTMDSGYTRVWGDTDCNSPTSSGSLELEPEQSRTFEMTGWSRTTSAPDSCDNREPVGPGAYMVYGHIGDNTSEQQTFNLA
ncbi:MAG: hypothetical protein ACTH1D_12680 [Mycobacteriaceae bacterium]